MGSQVCPAAPLGVRTHTRAEAEVGLPRARQRCPEGHPGPLRHLQLHRATLPPRGASVPAPPGVRTEGAMPLRLRSAGLLTMPADAEDPGGLGLHPRSSPSPTEGEEPPYCTGVGEGWEKPGVRPRAMRRFASNRARAMLLRGFWRGEHMSRSRYTSRRLGAARRTAAVRAGILKREHNPQTFGNRSEKELNLFSSKPVFLLPATSPRCCVW